MAYGRSDRYLALPPSRAEKWAGFGKWPITYFPALVGLVVEDVRIDYCRMRLAWRVEISQPAGVAHGGAIASLIDSVVVPAIGGGYDEEVGFSTITLSVQYRSALRGEDAIAEGWVSQRGRSMLFCDVEVRGAQSGRVIATGQPVYKLVSRVP